jgi:hypothetical protein
MRTETVMRCENIEDLEQDKAEPLDSDLLIKVADKNGKSIVKCTFSKDNDIFLDPGITGKILDDEGK